MHDGFLEFRLAIALRFVKGERFYARDLNGGNLVSVVYYENEALFRNCILFFIVFVLADNVFKHFRSIEDILNANLNINTNPAVLDLIRVVTIPALT